MVLSAHPPIFNFNDDAVEIGPRGPSVNQKSADLHAKGQLMPKRLIILLVAATLVGCLFAPKAQALGRVGGGVGIMGDNYSIMAPERGSRVQTPEPWLAPTYKSPRGTVKHVVIPKSKIVSPPNAAVPPSLFVPQTGQTFQNLPTLSGSGHGGAETFQDRAARCAHQAGVYGQATTGSYMGACVNQ